MTTHNVATETGTYRYIGLWGGPSHRQMSQQILKTERRVAADWTPMTPENRTWHRTNGERFDTAWEATDPHGEPVAIFARDGKLTVLLCNTGGRLPADNATIALRIIDAIEGDHADQAADESPIPRAAIRNLRDRLRELASQYVATPEDAGDKRHVAWLDGKREAYTSAAFRLTELLGYDDE